MKQVGSDVPATSPLLVENETLPVGFQRIRKPTLCTAHVPYSSVTQCQLFWITSPLGRRQRVAQSLGCLVHLAPPLKCVSKSAKAHGEITMLGSG
jgi:hypothetical protein